MKAAYRPNFEFIGYNMIIYVYGKCSTCQNALKFLKAKEISFIQREITETPPTISELGTMLRYVEGDVKKLFNSSGLLYREMQLTEKLKTMSEKEALKLLNSHGMLVKRPFLIGDDFGIIGFNAAKWSEKILKA